MKVYIGLCFLAYEDGAEGWLRCILWIKPSDYKTQFVGVEFGRGLDGAGGELGDDFPS